MKLKIQRMSSRPVTLEYLEKYDEEWKRACDKIQEKAKLDMQRAQKLYERVERILLSKYKVIEEWDLQFTEEELKEINKEYGPLMIAMHANGEELVGIIMDQPIF